MSETNGQEVVVVELEVPAVHEPNSVQATLADLTARVEALESTAKPAAVPEKPTPVSSAISPPAKSDTSGD